LTRDIQAQLSSRKLDALEGAPRWEASATALRTRLRQAQQSMQDAFEERKRATLALLHAKLNIPAHPELLPVIFNPAAPDAALAEVAQSVSRLLTSRCERVTEQLKRWRDDLQQVSTREGLSHVPDALQQQEQCRAMLLDMADAIAQLQAQHRDAERVEHIADVSANGGLSRVLDSMADTFGAVGQLGAAYHEFASALTEQLLTPDESQLFDVVENVWKTQQGAFELSALLNAPGAGNADEVWARLRSLHGKRQLRLHVVPAHDA
jgi:hypothetical protein